MKSTKAGLSYGLKVHNNTNGAIWKSTCNSRGFKEWTANGCANPPLYNEAGQLSSTTWRVPK